MTIGKPVLCLFFSFFLPLASKAAQPNYITYENKRMGTLEKPYLLGPRSKPRFGRRSSFPPLRVPVPPLFPFQRAFVHKRILWNDPRHSGRHQRKLRSLGWPTYGIPPNAGYSTLGQTDSSIWRAIGVRPKAGGEMEIIQPVSSGRSFTRQRENHLCKSTGSLIPGK